MLEQNSSTLFQVLRALIAIILVTRVSGYFFKKIGQPQVMGEIVGGILLGPSFLGWLSPSMATTLLPQSLAPQLNIIAQIGILFYMFLVGLEIDLESLKQNVRSTVIISNISIVVPFILGFIISKELYKTLAPPDINFISFALFVGVSLSVTAFPVLARILTDQNLHTSPLGRLALTCAAIDDISAWCLLAFVVSFASARFSNAFLTVGATVIFILTMLFLIRPFLKKRLSENINEQGIVIVISALLLSALTTEFIGIHALFGAFLFGAIVPHEHALAKTLHFRLNEFIRLFFLPVFFAFTGMKTKINLVSTPRDWFLCAVIIVAAIAGKFGGTFIAARLSGYNGKQATSLGILMNTRGLVELIVLNIGLDLGVISPTLYTMLVIMALVTTFMTGPLMKMTRAHSQWEI